MVSSLAAVCALRAGDRLFRWTSALTNSYDVIRGEYEALRAANVSSDYDIKQGEHTVMLHGSRVWLEGEGEKGRHAVAEQRRRVGLISAIAQRHPHTGNAHGVVVPSVCAVPV